MDLKIKTSIGFKRGKDLHEQKVVSNMGRLELVGALRDGGEDIHSPRTLPEHSSLVEQSNKLLQDGWECINERFSPRSHRSDDQGVFELTAPKPGQHGYRLGHHSLDALARASGQGEYEYHKND